jgi:hypothetical protein
VSDDRTPPLETTFLVSEMSHLVRYIDNASYLDLCTIEAAAGRMVEAIEVELRRRRS